MNQTKTTIKKREERSDVSQENSILKLTSEFKVKTYQNKLPLFPLSKLREIAAFFKYASQKYNSEAYVVVTLNEENEWEVICPHQVVKGTLDVEFDLDDEENKKLFEPYQEQLLKVYCTIHSHNTSGAFQSGKDEEDEIRHNGWHITIGKCTSELEYHARFTFLKIAEFDQEGNKTQEAQRFFFEVKTEDLVETDLTIEGFSDNEVKKFLMKKPSDTFPDEWKERITKKTYYSQRTALPFFRGEHQKKSSKGNQNNLNITTFDDEDEAEVFESFSQQHKHRRRQAAYNEITRLIHNAFQKEKTKQHQTITSFLFGMYQRVNDAVDKLQDEKYGDLFFYVSQDDILAIADEYPDFKIGKDSEQIKTEITDCIVIQ